MPNEVRIRVIDRPHAKEVLTVLVRPRGLAFAFKFNGDGRSVRNLQPQIDMFLLAVDQTLSLGLPLHVFGVDKAHATQQHEEVRVVEQHTMLGHKHPMLIPQREEGIHRGVLGGQAQASGRTIESFLHTP